MNGPYFSLRQYRDRDQDLQNNADAELEAAREADSFSFGPRQKLTNTRLESEMIIEPPEDFMPDACHCSTTKPPCSYCEKHGDDK